MKRDYSLFVKDIYEAIKKIEQFIGDMNFDDFMKNDMTKSAVVWKLHLIGEATKNIPKFIRDKYRDLPWKQMARMRDKISHFYFGVNYYIVWVVIKERLPEIKPKIRRILKELKDQK